MSLRSCGMRILSEVLSLMTGLGCSSRFEKSGGWVFWTWKCNWIGGKDEWRWCYESAVAAGAIPEDATTASSISPC